MVQGGVSYSWPLENMVEIASTAAGYGCVEVAKVLLDTSGSKLYMLT